MFSKEAFRHSVFLHFGFLKPRCKFRLMNKQKRAAAAALFFYVYMVDYFAFSINTARAEDIPVIL